MSNTPSLPDRQPLRDMTPAQQAEWYAMQKAELEEFCSYAQQWTKRREGRGKQNYHDQRYHQFFSIAADLITGLDELYQEAERQAAQEEES